jgi:hypothetical protein
VRNGSLHISMAWTIRSFSSMLVFESESDEDSASA